MSTPGHLNELAELREQSARRQVNSRIDRRDDDARCTEPANHPGDHHTYNGESMRSKNAEAIGDLARAFDAEGMPSVARYVRCGLFK